MPEFILDTGRQTWLRPDTFARGYVEALFFTNSIDPEDELHGLTVDSFAPETVAMIASDCAAFMARFPDGFGNADEAQAGRDFWFTRCGHGVGFWDRPEIYGQALADKLSAAARDAGNLDPTKGDDGKIYLG